MQTEEAIKNRIFEVREVLNAASIEGNQVAVNTNAGRLEALVWVLSQDGLR